VGLRVVQAVRERLGDREDLEILEDVRGGLQLMEQLVGYDRAIIVDAILTGVEPGTLHRLTPADIPTQKTAGAHDVNLPTSLELGRQVGSHLPADEQILLIGIEAEDVHTFGETCTPAVEAAIPQAVELVLELIGRTGARIDSCQGDVSK
jgi:hydrogenase maturation protease